MTESGLRHVIQCRQLRSREENMNKRVLIDGADEKHNVANKLLSCTGIKQSSIPICLSGGRPETGSGRRLKFGNYLAIGGER